MRATRADTMLKLWRAAHLRRPVHTEREAEELRLEARGDVAEPTPLAVVVAAPAPAASGH